MVKKKLTNKNKKPESFEKLYKSLPEQLQDFNNTLTEPENERNKTPVDNIVKKQKEQNKYKYKNPPERLKYFKERYQKKKEKITPVYCPYCNNDYKNILKHIKTNKHWNNSFYEIEPRDKEVFDYQIERLQNNIINI
jgi:hypothetical protein